MSQSLKMIKKGAPVKETSVTGPRILIKVARVFVSSFAFLVVAFLAAIAGYSLATQDFSFTYLRSHGLVVIILYVLLLWPYYASRHGLLERTLPHPKRPIDIDSIRYGIEFPAYIIIVVGSIAFVIFGNYLQPPYSLAWRDVLLSFAFGLLPFFIIFIASLRDLADSNTNRAFQFIERVFYPALCTGIIPFSFGWSISSGRPDSGIVAAAAIYVLLLIFVAKISAKNELRWIVGTMLFVPILYLVFRLEELKVIFIGTVILLAMGVSEVSKRVCQAKIPDRHFPPKQGYKYYLAGANWASIVFLWSLSLVPLAISELPTLPIVVFISLQSLVWFYANDSFKWSRKASIMSLIFGYGLPIVIILTRALDLPPTFLSGSGGTDTLIGLPALMIAIAAFFLPDLRKISLIIDNVSDNFRVNPSDSVRNNYYLFFLVIIAMMIITGLTGTYSDNQLIRTKASEINELDTIIFLILLVSYFWQARSKGFANGNHVE